MKATIPAGWEMTSLSDLGRWTGGGTPSKANPAFWVRKGIPWVSPKDMKRFLIDDAEDHITKAAVAASTTNVVPNNSILIVTRSGILSHTLPVAKTLLPVAINQDLKALVAGKQYDPDFLLYALRGYEDSIHRECRKSGTTVANLDTTRLLAFVIPIPPLEEQRRIVTKLDRFINCSKSARNELARIPRLIERYKQAILASAFSGELTADWRKSHRGNVSAFIKREERLGASTQNLPLLTKGWAWAAAGSLCAIKSGITLGKKRPPRTELIERPYLRVANVQRGWLKLDEVKTIAVAEKEAETLYLQPGDVLMNEGGDRDKLGRGWVWNGEIPNCIHQNHVFRLRPRSSELPSTYISYYANEFGQNYFLREGKQTTNLASISMSKISALPIPVAPSDEMARIVALIEDGFAAIDKIAAETSRGMALLERLDQATLEKAFRGELLIQEEEQSSLVASNGSNSSRRKTDVAR
jgi:type I restriction enzyme S subunit